MSQPPEIEGMVELVLHKVLGCRSPGPSRACVQAGPGLGISWSWVRGPPPPLSLPSGQSLQPLKEGYQACKLGIGRIVLAGSYQTQKPSLDYDLAFGAVLK